MMFSQSRLNHLRNELNALEDEIIIIIQKYNSIIVSRNLDKKHMRYLPNNAGIMFDGDVIVYYINVCGETEYQYIPEKWLYDEFEIERYINGLK